MFIEEKYIINPHFMYLFGQYDRNAKLFTIVTELHRTFLVDKAPLEILDDSIKCIGFDLRGAMATAKSLLGNKHMCPIMVNPVHNICVFPDKSAKHVDTMWFNPLHITRTNHNNRKTKVEFTNGMAISVPSKLSSFNHKLQTAEQFRRMTVGLENESNSFKHGPKKGA